MSTSIKNLRQLAKPETSRIICAIFDSYVVLGRDIDYLATNLTGSGEYRQSAGRLRGADSKTEAPV